VNTLGSTLLIENDGTATLNFSNTQLSIIQAPSSGDRITMKRIDAAENLGIDPRSIIKTSSGNIVIQTTTKSKYVAGNDQFRFLFGEPATSLNKANAKGVTAITGKASMVDGVLKVDLDITVYLRTYLTSSHGDTTLMPKFGELQHVQDYWDAREGLIPLLEKSLKMNIPESVLVNVIEGYFDKARKQTIATWDAEGKPHAPGGVAEVPSNFSDYPASWWK
ncbi:hypothetical protein, partial [Ereboglobus sp. PH5-5]|uniref:hypothetical protein n=1 Tax=Ereboglobus sp. PH5-5 TaxID=2940529 RepID=UPI0024067326